MAKAKQVRKITMEVNTDIHTVRINFKMGNYLFATFILDTHTSMRYDIGTLHFTFKNPLYVKDAEGNHVIETTITYKVGRVPTPANIMEDFQRAVAQWKRIHEDSRLEYLQQKYPEFNIILSQTTL